MSGPRTTTVRERMIAPVLSAIEGAPPYPPRNVMSINACNPAESSANSSGRSLHRSRNSPVGACQPGGIDRPGVHADDLKLAPAARRFQAARR
jgi:hypothetical protein